MTPPPLQLPRDMLSARIADLRGWWKEGRKVLIIDLIDAREMTRSAREAIDKK